MASPKRVRCSCARPSCTRPLEDGEVDNDKADGDLDTLEEELEKNENGQQVSHRVPREGGGGDDDDDDDDDGDDLSSSDSDEEPTDYHCGIKEDDEPLSDDPDLDPGESDDAESDCAEEFMLEGGRWRMRQAVRWSRRRDRDGQYNLQKHEWEVSIERDALLGKLARIGGSASAGAAPPDDKPETRFMPWKTVDWTQPDVTGVEAAMDGSRLQPQAIKRVLAFFEAHPYVKRDKCEAFCLEAYGVNDAHACLSEFQFDNGYMMEVLVMRTGTDNDGAATDTHMTLFFFTFEAVDEAAIAAARAAYGDFVPTYTNMGSLKLGHGQPELFAWRIECVRGRPFSAEAGRLTRPINGSRYEKVLRSYVDFSMAPMLRRGGVASADAWPTAPHNLHCDGDNVIVRPGLSGVGGLVLWTAQASVEPPLGASLCGLWRLLGQPMREKAVAKPNKKPWVPVDLLPFEGYHRNWADLELLCLEHLQTMQVVKSDARSWERIFTAMIEAEDLATNTADEDKLYYKRAAEILSGTWFHAKLGGYSVKYRLDDAPEGEEHGERLASVDIMRKRKRGQEGGEDP